LGLRGRNRIIFIDKPELQLEKNKSATSQEKSSMKKPHQENIDEAFSI
jgi:hypothetical protein